MSIVITMGFEGCWNGLRKRTCWKHGSVVLGGHIDSTLYKGGGLDCVIPQSCSGAIHRSASAREGFLSLESSLEGASYPVSWSDTGQVPECLQKKTEGEQEQGERSMCS